MATQITDVDGMAFCQRQKQQKQHRHRYRRRPPLLLALALFSASLFCALLTPLLPCTWAQLDPASEDNSVSMEDEVEATPSDWLLRRLDNLPLLDSSSSSAEEEREKVLTSLSRRSRASPQMLMDTISSSGGVNTISESSGSRVNRRSRQHKQQKELPEVSAVSEESPIHILFPLPTDEGRRNENPFGITILKAKPVVDEAVEEVYRRSLVPPNSLDIHFEDSMLSDAHGPNVAINMLVNNQLDCIIGYAFVYALAPVARMSPYWKDKDSNGIPVITSVGLTSNLDNRREYQLMTRISSPYKVVKNAVVAMFEEMQWNHSAYLFHEQRHDATNPSIPYGECYLLLASVQPHLYRRNRMEHNYFMFNELNYNPDKMKENLQRISVISNVN